MAPALRLSKLGVVAVEGHLILLVGSQLVGYVLGLAVGSFEHQHQTGIAVVVALHALVAHHVLSLQAEIVLNVHGCDLELVGDGVGFQQSIENTVQCIRAVLGSIVHNSGCGGAGSGRFRSSGGNGGGSGRRAGGTAAAGKSDSSQRAGESNCKDFCAIYHKIFLLLFKTFSQLPKAVQHQGRLLLSYHNCVQNATKSPSVLRIFNR